MANRSQDDERPDGSSEERVTLLFPKVDYDCAPVAESSSKKTSRKPTNRGSRKRGRDDSDRGSAASAKRNRKDATDNIADVRAQLADHIKDLPIDLHAGIAEEVHKYVTKEGTYIHVDGLKLPELLKTFILLRQLLLMVVRETLTESQKQSNDEVTMQIESNPSLLGLVKGHMEQSEKNRHAEMTQMTEYTKLAEANRSREAQQQLSLTSSMLSEQHKSTQLAMKYMHSCQERIEAISSEQQRLSKLGALEDSWTRLKDILKAPFQSLSGIDALSVTCQHRLALPSSGSLSTGENGQILTISADQQALQILQNHGNRTPSADSRIMRDSRSVAAVDAGSTDAEDIAMEEPEELPSLFVQECDDVKKAINKQSQLFKRLAAAAHLDAERFAACQDSPRDLAIIEALRWQSRTLTNNSRAVDRNVSATKAADRDALQKLLQIQDARRLIFSRLTVALLDQTLDRAKQLTQIPQEAENTIAMRMTPIARRIANGESYPWGEPSLQLEEIEARLDVDKLEHFQLQSAIPDQNGLVESMPVDRGVEDLGDVAGPKTRGKLPATSSELVRRFVDIRPEDMETPEQYDSWLDGPDVPSSASTSRVTRSARGKGKDMPDGYDYAGTETGGEDMIDYSEDDLSDQSKNQVGSPMSV